MSIYRYFTKQRPPSPGAIPSMNLISAVGYDGKEWREEACVHAWGYADYTQPLSANQINNYEMAGPVILTKDL